MKSKNSGGSFWTWTVQIMDPQRADHVILGAMQADLGVWSSEKVVVTRSQLKRLIEEAKVFSNGAVIKPSQSLKSGAQIKIDFPPPVPTELVAENIHLEIMYEDSDLLVVNKPQGLTVHPSSTQAEGTLVHALLYHIKDLSGIGGVLRPGIVHRLDKNTSGALVITKNDVAHTRLAEIFSKHEIERTYWALCYGTPKDLSTHQKKKVESLIGRHPTERKKMSMNVKEGRKAVTHFLKKREFSLSHKNPFASWIEATLETGRTHQVRVHLTGIGHSLFGDPTYGTPTTNQTKWQAIPREIQKLIQELPGQALHARVLGFKHPITGKSLRFEAEPPLIFKKLLDALERY